MTDAPFEIKDDEINVEEIMEKIRENIRRRKEAGVYPPDPAPPQVPAGTDSGVARDLAHLSSNWDIQNNSYFISSHRPVAGKFLVKGRELVHGEVRRYVDPVIWKQTEFNRVTARLLNEISQQLPEIDRKLVQIEMSAAQAREQNRNRVLSLIDEVTAELRGDIGQSEAMIREQTKSAMDELAVEIDAEVGERVSRLAAAFDDRLAQIEAALRQDLEGRLADLVQQFDDTIRERAVRMKAEVAEEVGERIRAEVTGFVPQMKAEIAEEVEERIRTEVTGVVPQMKAEIAEEVGEQIRTEVTGVVPQMKAEVAEEVGERIRAEVTGFVPQMKAEIAEEVGEQIRTEVTEQVRSALLAMDTDIENRAWLAKVLEGRALRSAPGEVDPPDSPFAGTGLNYFVFEDHFRGSREDIRERQRAFVRYFEGCRNVLDIGCGRGEFLELMRDAGIGARGVDLDETMVDFCRSRGLEVELNDAVSYLEHLEDESLDGIFIDQVVEHLEPAYLIRLLELCYRKLKFGYYIVAETVNPLSFVSFANFYIDMTHVRPVHPETLKFLFGAAGFRGIEVQFSAPVPDEARLRKLPVNEGIGEAERQHVEAYNRNIDLLNGTLFGAQDYAMIGKK